MPARVEPRLVVEMMCPYEAGTPVEEVRRHLGLGSFTHLASNENPLGPSPRVMAALADADLALHKYPDNESHLLRTALAARLGVTTANIIVGAGSSDLMPLIADTFLDTGDDGLVADLCFPVYEHVIRLAGARPVVVPLDDNLGYDLERMLTAVTPATKVVFIASPNNPTGRSVPWADVKAFVTRLPDRVLCVLDLAYHEYDPRAGAAGELLAAHPNLLLLYTFSKVYGLAGLRVGYGVAAARVIDALRTVQTPFHTSSAGQLAARVAIEDRAHVAQAVRANSAGLNAMTRGLEEIGVRVDSSQANFVLAHVGRPAEMAFQGLLRRGVIVRPVRQKRARQCLRITVGTPLQIEQLVGALEETLRESGAV